jgi:ubiquinone/menaquinone biosynthesis C-methylase UbiE
VNDFRHYSGVAETYDRVRAPQTATVAADLIELAEPPAGARILDVGSGTGSATEVAASAVAGSSVVGVDRSVEMVGVGRRSRPTVPALAAEAIQLPFRDGAFDVVIASFVLAEFTRFDTALFDLLRVLKPGGKLAASTWVNETDELSSLWRSLVEETIGQELFRSALQEAAPWAERFGDRGRLDQTLRDAGFRPVHVEQRSYRFEMSRDDYVDEQATRTHGRFLREMLGERGWVSFLDRAKQAYASRFAERIGDTREVLVAVATKP